MSLLHSFKYAAMTFGFLAPSLAMADNGALVPVSVNRVFAPQNFDDNDEAMVVLDGFLPSSCFRLANTEAAFDQETSTWKVTQYARFYDSPCMPSGVPFFTEVRLGKLAEGAYKITSEGAKLETMQIKRSSNLSPDDHIYAPIEGAYVERSQTTGRYEAVIMGRKTNSCMTLAVDDVMIIESGETVELLPVMKEFQGPNCRTISDVSLLTARVPLPANIQPGHHLLHVRSLNGKAVNTVFTVERQL